MVARRDRQILHPRPRLRDQLRPRQNRNRNTTNVDSSSRRIHRRDESIVPRAISSSASALSPAPSSRTMRRDGSARAADSRTESSSVSELRHSSSITRATPALGENARPYRLLALAFGRKRHEHRPHAGGQNVGDGVVTRLGDRYSRAGKERSEVGAIRLHDCILRGRTAPVVQKVGARIRSYEDSPSQAFVETRARQRGVHKPMGHHAAAGGDHDFSFAHSGGRSRPLPR